eukprot:6173679-Pleurochrysis_carterae.AAC.2
MMHPVWSHNCPRPHVSTPSRAGTQRDSRVQHADGAQGERPHADIAGVHARASGVAYAAAEHAAPATGALNLPSPRTPTSNCSTHPDNLILTTSCRP